MEALWEDANEERGISTLVEKRRLQEVMLVWDDRVNSYMWRREPVEPPSNICFRFGRFTRMIDEWMMI